MSVVDFGVDAGVAAGVAGVVDATGAGFGVLSAMSAIDGLTLNARSATITIVLNFIGLISLPSGDIRRRSAYDPMIGDRSYPNIPGSTDNELRGRSIG